MKRNSISAVALVIGVLFCLAFAGIADAAVSGTWGDNGHTYTIVEASGMAWDTAVAAVPAGQHLATITSQAERDFVNSLLTTNEITGQYWLGGTQTPQNTKTNPKDGWDWITCEDWGYTNWPAWEPNDADGTIPEFRLAMASPYPYDYWTVGGPWNDEQNLGNITGYITETGTPIEIIPNDDALALLDEGIWPPNHKYHTITIADLVESVSDSCNSVSIYDIVITSVSSDEPEDAVGDGDGNTMDDIVIVDDQTVNLRSERQGTSNGRVYTIYYEVTSSNGYYTATGFAKVGVPHEKNVPAVDGPGPGYSVP